MRSFRRGPVLRGQGRIGLGCQSKYQHHLMDGSAVEVNGETRPTRFESGDAWLRRPDEGVDHCARVG